jgi:hypothetical protein
MCSGWSDCLSIASSYISAILSSTAANNAAHSGLKLGSTTRCRRDIEAINRKEIVQTYLAISVGLSDSTLTACPVELSLKCQWVFSSSTYTAKDWLSRFASAHPEVFASDGAACPKYRIWIDSSKMAERAMSSVLLPRVSSRKRVQHLESEGAPSTCLIRAANRIDEHFNFSPVNLLHRGQSPNIMVHDLCRFLVLSTCGYTMGNPST